MKKFRAALLLLVTTFFWGVGFTIVKDAINRVDVFVFQSQRFLLATALMLPWALLRLNRFNVPTLINGAVLGTLLFGAYAFQTVGLRFTSASNVGFLTGLNVVLVPVFDALFFRAAIGRSIKWGVGLALVGLFLLCGNGHLSFNGGDLLAGICGACVALHVLCTGRFARKESSDVYVLTTVQLTTVGLWSLAFTGRSLPRVFVWYPELFWTLVICVVIATVFAFLVQTSMQRFISPSHTALIFCTEPVFGAAYAYLAAGERLGPYGYLGALLILAGMIISEVLPDEAVPDAALTPLPEG